MLSIAIIGAGLMGRLTALTLHQQYAEKGYQITLMDKDTKSGQHSAAYAAAGLLTPLGEAMHCQQSIVEMGAESLKLWPDILATLDHEVFFQQSGAVMVAHDQDKGDYQKVHQYLQKHYATSSLFAEPETLNREQLLALEPELGQRFTQGLFLADEGQIDNRQLLTALQHQLAQLPINWISQCEVKSIENETRVHYQIKDSLILEQSFSLVIDCRGLGAKQNAHIDQSQLTQLRGVRGELIHLFAPDVNIKRPLRLMHPRYQLYIAPKSDHHYVIGATEIESEDDAPTTVRAALELLSAAYSVHPGFAEAQIKQHVCQLRPAFNDNQPKILLHPSHTLIQVNGLYRHGFLIAPVVLKQVNCLVMELLSRQNQHSSTSKMPMISTHFRYSHLLPITFTEDVHHEYSH